MKRAYHTPVGNPCTHCLIDDIEEWDTTKNPVVIETVAEQTIYELCWDYHIIVECVQLVGPGLLLNIKAGLYQLYDRQCYMPLKLLTPLEYLSITTRGKGALSIYWKKV